ncbi:MAG: aerobic C4-dicarboxylate transport protein [Pseudonocardiales bacterium]|nr:aerobic C4-dicarboxylate transport protein [Pseudonocardiales bacterium]
MTMTQTTTRAVPTRHDRTHWLYLTVIAAVAAGIIVGLTAPGTAVQLKPLGDTFVSLVKMMISPVIFCTIVLGVGSVRQAAKVGRVGAVALGYFLAMSTVALGIGLVVGNLIHPGSGLHLTTKAAAAGAKAAGSADSTGFWGFVQEMVPTTLLSSLTSGQVLQTLLIGLLAGFAIQALGPAGEPVLRGVGSIQKVVFKILSMIMWLAPLGAFGAMAAVVGATGFNALKSLAVLMLAFYLTCAIFVFGVLGSILRVAAGVNIFSLFRYLAREFLLILSTSSSETALPRLIAKMEHLGVSRPVVGIVVPTGYSFNLDGTAIYLTMASLFVADAVGNPLSVGAQISLLLFMMLASKGAAGVTGAGLATLAGGLQSHRPDLVNGVGLIVGIDRFMSEARALTNFAGNAVATVLVGTWTHELDQVQLRQVLSGQAPFHEAQAAAESTAHAPAQATTGPGQSSGTTIDTPVASPLDRELSTSGQPFTH